MMSLAILAALAMLSAKAVQQGVRAKMKIQGQIDDVSRVRDALRLIERDINLAYHYRDIELELQQDLKKLQSNPPPGTPPTPDIVAEAPRKDPVTQFVGHDQDMSFVTTNTARMIQNSRQADFIEVGYSLKTCKSAGGESSSKCLWRRSSNIVDDDVTIGGDETVLLEDVTEFALAYIGKGKQDWVKEWRTDTGGDAATKGAYPQAVKVSLSVQKLKKKYKMEVVASVHFPNNKEDASDPNAPAGSTTVHTGDQQDPTLDPDPTKK